MRDVIFCGMEIWDDVWRRSQNLIAAFARRYPERKVLFVSLPSDLLHAVRARDGRELAAAMSPAPPEPVSGFPNIYAFRPGKVLPNRTGFSRRINHDVMTAQVRRASESLGMDHPYLWIKPHWYCHFAGKLNEAAVIYDLGDDWTAASMSDAARRVAVAEDEYLTRRADAVVVVSERLREMKRKLIPDVHLIPNGVDAARYYPVSERTLPPLPLAALWRKPVLGYTGMLHPDRLDIDLTIEIARRFPESTLAMVGPSFLDAQDTARLSAEPNIEIPGPVSFWDLPRLMTSFDVCIVPNLVNSLSESQNPLKMFEYLAAGLPTVTTRVSGFRDYPELVYLATDADEFEAGIRAALKEPKSLTDKRRQEAAPHTWDARLDKFIEIFDGLEASVTVPPRVELERV